jgi:monoamine oxidase
MKRSEFIKNCLALGLSVPFLSLLLESCKKEDFSFPQFEVNFTGKVLIVGGGVAGLTAGYILHRHNIDFEIIEAAPQYGGRVKRVDGFADFPIDLGAEWIHASPSVLSEILKDPQSKASVDYITYNPQTIYNWKNNKLKKQNWASNYYSEYKFKSTTWYGFFEQHIVPRFQDKIQLNSPVQQINYSGNKIKVQTAQTTYEGDKVLITVPVNVMKSGMIDFVPPLPDAKVNAYNSIQMGDGIKVFIEFKEHFYPDILMFGGLIAAQKSSERLYYNAAFRKNSDKNILGLFTVQDAASAYTNLGSDQEIIDHILTELDTVFDGKATPNYLNHVIQNWSKEPYILGSYSNGFTQNQSSTVNTILSPVDKKIYFAGEALSIDNQATVHGACETAYTMVEKILKN